MKKLLALTMALVCILGLAACGGQPVQEEEEPLQQDFVPSEHMDIAWEAETGGVSSIAKRNDFKLTLYIDKPCYTTDEEIKIWATLEYTGDKDAVTIWHGDPCITFSITDGKDFGTGGMIMTVLTSTELEKGTVYEFAYQKSGGFAEDDPDADFWREFYQEDALKLPAGTYTVMVDGAFYLSEEQLPEEKGPICQRSITVTEAASDLPVEAPAAPEEETQPVVPNTVAQIGQGTIAAEVELSQEDAQTLTRIIETGNWNTEGTADCLNDCVLNLNGRSIYYHSSCGTFNVNDPTTESADDGASLSLTDTEQATVNGILEKYITLGEDVVP